jgi:hypothetical protein
MMKTSELEERLRSASKGSAGSSSLSPGAKYSLWRAASDLPLHRVSDRLSVSHLQPRSSQDRYRIIHASQRDGKLPLMDSSLFLPLQKHEINSGRRKHEKLTTITPHYSFRERLCNLPPPLSHEKETDRADSILSKTGAEKVPYQPIRPSRLGQRSLTNWTSMYSDDKHTHHDTVDPPAKSVGGSEGVKVGNQGVKLVTDSTHRGKQDLLVLQSTGRNCVSNHPVKRHRRSKPRSHVTDHMTSCYGDVSPPPSPPYRDLRIGF